MFKKKEPQQPTPGYVTEQTSNQAHNENDSSSNSNRRRGEGWFSPTFCNIFGFALILGVFALIIPLTVPQMMGLEVFHIVSPDMEPTIPSDSVIYVAPIETAGITNDEIIAYYADEDTVVIHRVTFNDIAKRQLITKGDAN